MNPLLSSIRESFRVSAQAVSDVVRFQLLAYSSSDQRPPSTDVTADELNYNGDLYTSNKKTEAVPCEEAKYWLHLYGRTPSGHSIAVHVDYSPSLMVCLPDGWGAEEASKLFNKLCQQRRIPSGFITRELVHYHRLGGFYPDLEASTPRLKKFPFLRISCRSLAYWKIITNFFRFTKLTIAGVRDHLFPIIEQDIPPVLDLLNTCHGRPSDGLEIDSNRLKQLTKTRLTHCDLEFECRVTPTDCPLRPVELTELYPLVVLSFDIECVPGDGRSFPSAENRNDSVITICSVVKNMKTGAICRASHMLGAHLPLDSTVHQFTYSSEAQLIEEWRDFVVCVDPDIITGYNSHRFDWPYLATRMQLYDPNSRFFFVSRLIMHCSVMEEKEFSSKAFGSSTTSKFDIPGRIDVDLCTYVMRNYKMKSYKLEKVAQYFLGQGKSGLAITEMIAHFQSKDPEKMREIVRYCLQDAELPILIWDHQRI